MNATDITTFLDRVLDWPGANAPGFINLHANTPNTDPKKNGGKPWMTGYPFQTRDEFLAKAQSIAAMHASSTPGVTPWLFNSWFCMSKQSSTKLNTKGDVRAAKGTRTAVGVKSIWLDIDIKVGPENYNSLTEALTALTKFVADCGLPKPTAIVNSGGGLHVYWISDVALSPADWMPYAQGLKSLAVTKGLKCDSGLTTDIARLLRVPGTYNHKYDPPAVVKLLKLDSHDLNFPSQLAFLSLVPAPVQKTVTAAVSAPKELFVNGDVFSAPDAAFASLNSAEALAPPRLDDPLPILEKCGFYSSMLANGGAGVDNTLWNMAILGTTFMEGGNVIAHEISKGWTAKDGSSAYSAEDTQAQFERKLAERADGRIKGPPTCGAIEGAGCTDCTGCPLKSKIKTPLSIRPVAATPTAVVPRPAVPNVYGLLLPDDYRLDGRNIINYVYDKADRAGNIITIWEPLFECVIDQVRISHDSRGDIFHFHIEVDKGNNTWATIHMVDLGGTGYEKKLLQQRLLYDANNKGRLEKFFVSFMRKMHAAMASAAPAQMGWHRTSGAAIADGFVYNDSVYNLDGSVTPTGMTIDKEMKGEYTPCGSLAPWFEAWNYVKMQQRPELELCVATAFAAPLMEMTGQSGVVFALTGDPSSSKSYATEVGCAVWMHPKKGKGGAKSTERAINDRLNQTGCMPNYLDEVTEEHQQRKAYGLMEDTTNGGGADRMDSNLNHRKRGEWSTIFCINGNKPFKDFIMKKQVGHGAGLNRVFEIWIKAPLPDAPGRVANTIAPDRALIALTRNYGNVGAVYAAYLAQNYDKIDKMIVANSNILAKAVGTVNADRMWIALMASTLTAVQVANVLPGCAVGFDEAAITQTLIEGYATNAKHRVEQVGTPGDAASYGDDWLTQYIKSRGNETIWATSSVTKSGRPGGVLWDKNNMNIPPRGGIQIRFDQTNNLMLFSKIDFQTWCAEDESRNGSAIIRALEIKYGMEIERRTLSAGTPYSGSQEACYAVLGSRHPEIQQLINHGAMQNQEMGTPTAVTAAVNASEFINKLAEDTGLADKVTF